MRRIAGLLLVLAVVLPVVFAYAASFNISYSGGTVIVVPIEDVVTETQGGPAPAATTAPSVMTYIEDTNRSTGSAPAVQSAASRPPPKPTATPTPTPRSLPKVPQVPGLSSGGRP